MASAASSLHLPSSHDLGDNGVVDLGAAAQRITWRIAYGNSSTAPQPLPFGPTHDWQNLLRRVPPHSNGGFADPPVARRLGAQQR